MKIGNYEFKTGIYEATLQPEEALSFLNNCNNTVLRNRPLNPHEVKKLTQEILNGRYLLNDEPIIITKSGALAQGQHRCHACVNSNKSIHTLLSIGRVDDKVFSTYDSHARRTVGDLLVCTKRIEEKDRHKYSGALQLLHRYINGIPALKANQKFHIDELFKTSDKHPMLKDSIEIGSKSKHISNSIAIFVHYAASLIDKNKADIFIKSFVRGSNCSEDNPILILRKKLEADKSNRRKLSDLDKLQYMIKTWNLYYNEKTVVALKLGTHFELFKPAPNFNIHPNWETINIKTSTITINQNK